MSLGRDPATHRYRHAAATVRGTKRDAQRAAAGLVSEADHGRIPLTKETFGGLLARWLDHIEARGRAPKTLVENRRMAAAITEQLGAKDLQKLKGSDLDALYDRLSRRGLSATSVRRYHAVCSAALNQGVRWGLLERSPAAQASPPSMVRKEPDAPTPEEIKLLIERAEAKDPELATLLFVAATTGCRRGELCGLRWSDVDFEKGVLLVRRSVSDLPGRVEIRSTKTGHIRKMALDSATLSVLELLRERAGARSAALGVTLDPDAYLWSSSAGRIVTTPSRWRHLSVHRSAQRPRADPHPSPSSPPFRRHGDAGRRRRRPHCRRQARALSSDSDSADVRARHGRHRSQGG